MLTGVEYREQHFVRIAQAIAGTLKVSSMLPRQLF